MICGVEEPAVATPPSAETAPQPLPASLEDLGPCLYRLNIPTQVEAFAQCLSAPPGIATKSRITRVQAQHLSLQPQRLSS